MTLDARLDTDRLLLEARGVHVWFERGMPGETHALDGVDLEMRAGDRVGLLGASGSGKSTLLHVLSRLQSPTRGEVLSQSPVLPSLVFQFPERQLFAETVAEEVGYGLAASGVTAAEIEERVRGSLDEVGLDAQTFVERSPFHLSGGERRRVALAGILAQRRSVVLLDEPTLGLDCDGTRRLAKITESLHARGVAYWLASHDTNFVAATCTQLYVLAAGRVAYQGPADAYWADAERAESHGVRLPRAAELANYLRVHDVTDLPALPEPAEFARALGAVRHKHDPT